MDELNQSQKNAIDAIVKWYKGDTYAKKWFFLTGSAGTGKTYLISKLHQYLDLDEDDIAYVTYTGKASLVLNDKGIPARTIHQYFYHFKGKDLEKQEILFTKRGFLPEDPELIIIDEVSMVPDYILTDILSFGVPLLCVGDLNQLQPVKAENTMITKPDINLTEIVRQAEDSPITKLAIDILEGTFRAGKDYGEGVYIARKGDITTSTLLKADQVLCGTHNTRKELNSRMRKELGFDDIYPSKGDKIICGENNWAFDFGDIPLVNGLITTIDEIEDSKKSPHLYSVKITFNKVQRCLIVPKSPFQNVDYSQKKDYDTTMEYGYAITCHKAQGSEFNKVAVICDWYNKQTRRNWLYTAVTRAKNQLLLGI